MPAAALAISLECLFQIIDDPQCRKEPNPPRCIPALSQGFICLPQGCVIILFIPPKPTCQCGSGNIALHRQDTMAQFICYAHKQGVSESHIANFMQKFIRVSIFDLQSPAAINLGCQIQR